MSRYRVKYIGARPIGVGGLGAFVCDKEMTATFDQACELFKSSRARAKRGLKPEFHILENQGTGWFRWDIRFDRPWNEEPPKPKAKTPAKKVTPKAPVNKEGV